MDMLQFGAGWSAFFDSGTDADISIITNTADKQVF